MARQRALLIAEKPSLMRTIRDAYEKHKSEFDFDIDFVAQAGHIFGLKLPKEINAEKYGKWVLSGYPEVYPYEYKVTTPDLFKKVKEAYKGDSYDFIIHAGDPDQEGEILIRETLDKLGNKKPVKRFWSNDITEGAVVSALKSMESDSSYDRFYHAALVRQHADYQFGMNCTGAMTCKTGDLCKIGRVKAAIGALIAERELEIQNYVEKKTYKPAFKYQDFEFVKNEVFETPELAMKSVPNTDTAAVTEARYEKKNVKPPKLYKLSTVQTDAHKAFGWKASKTLEVLQKLYEAKATSYPRTSCEYISSKEDIGGIAKKVVRELSLDTTLLTKDPSDVRKDRSYCNDKAIASEGHTGLIPTGNGLPGSASSDMRALYELISRRFVAIFAKDKVVMNAKVTGIPEGVKDLYVYTESYDIDPGYEFMLNPKYKERKGSGVEFKVGQKLNPIEFFPKEIVSQKPSRYNDGSLVKAMDQLTYEGENGKVTYSIGTAATRAGIIEECQKNGYFHVEKGSFVADDKLMAIYSAFKEVPIFDPVESGKWEEKLDAIRRGEADYTDVEEMLISKMEESVNAIKDGKVGSFEGKKKGHDHSSHDIGDCPNCHTPVKKGQYGLYCPGKCGMSFGKVFGKSMTDKEWSDALHGKQVHLKGLTSKAGKKYNVCLTPNGVEDYSFVGKDGKKHEGKQVHFDSEFEK